MVEERTLRASDLQEGARFLLASDQILEPGDGREAAIAKAETEIRIDHVTDDTRGDVMVLVEFTDELSPGQTILVPGRYLRQVQVTA